MLTSQVKITEQEKWNSFQKEFYNSREHSRMWYDGNSHFVASILNKFIPFATLTTQEQILEIGCGAGRYTLPLLLRGYQLTAIDISERMLKKLQEDTDKLKIPEKQYTIMPSDIHSLNVENDKKFDIVIGFNVLHHLFDVKNCFENIARCLKKDGRMVFLEPNALNPLHYIDTLLDRGWQAEGHKFDSLPDRVRMSLTEAGFHNIQYRRFGFFPPLLINCFPSLLKTESYTDQFKFFNKVLPYFMIKGEF